MPVNKGKLDAKRSAELEEELARLDQELAEKQARYEKTEEQLIQRQAQFNAIQRKVKAFNRLKQNFIRFLRSTTAYLLGRRNLKQLYSRSYKRKKAENRLKKYRYYLYELGFTEKALADLEKLYEKPEDRYQKRAVAWELALWHAGKYSKLGVRQALDYLPVVVDGENDKDRLRKAAIIKAECHDILDEPEEGKKEIDQALRMQEHPDLYLAYANLEGAVEVRTQWINKVMEAYKLNRIYFRADKNRCGAKSIDWSTNSSEHEAQTCERSIHSTKAITYDDLTTQPIGKTIESGPKVTVILPAYNAENGISTAIESILSQTWQNIELLVVDDCSTDNTKDVVRDYMKHDSRIRLMSTPTNSGPYIARNIALQVATGDFVTVNDADDWSHAEKIEIQARHLMNNKKIMANTSEHARLTEQLKFYRRGTPGTYIFSNMSSLMFRREPVMKKMGYWDSVRFAADGEFKRRLLKVFGKASIVDLKTGPLSLPRQSVASLTGSSAFGYSGFFKGVRKEYVESFEFYHNRTDSLCYPTIQQDRLFPIPEPMWPKRETKTSGHRHVDIVVAADFRLSADLLQETMDEIRAYGLMGMRTGLVQMGEYQFSTPRTINPAIRELIDGCNVQMLVYGESITCDILIIKSPSILQERQQYIPDIKPNTVLTVMEQPPSQMAGYDIRTCSKRIVTYFDKKGKWYPKNQTIRDILKSSHGRELRFIHMANENWQDVFTRDRTSYGNFLENWLVDENPYVKGDGDDKQA
ncbi:Glycosyl transferase family 2 [Lentibacillus halodurans]|uniref:Glycosyl transferase family 2 n=1 Tax=Lentibacillus halodurans TaxID=237679 RepID=A0A1I0ZNI6_9BACI|nr:glycosyltransferase [Lentibacillus halodurans]SFB27369.1 Glycosyl transferase family 2 [Lentibacillus halodurans]